MPIEVGNLKLFTIKELESLLDVSQNTVRSYLRTGKLKGRKLGVKWFVTEESLTEYFALSERIQKNEGK